MNRRRSPSVPEAVILVLRLVVSAFITVLGAAMVGGVVAFVLFPALGWGAGVTGLMFGMLGGLYFWEVLNPNP